MTAAVSSCSDGNMLLAAARAETRMAREMCIVTTFTRTRLPYTKKHAGCHVTRTTYLLPALHNLGNVGAVLKHVEHVWTLHRDSYHLGRTAFIVLLPS